MTPSIMQFRQTSPAIRRLMMALVIAAALGSVSMPQAHSDDYHGHQNRGWHRGERNHHRDWHDRPYYPAPVYIPPPVYYAPPPSPGVSLFFPLDFRN